MEKLVLMLLSAIVGYAVKWLLPGGTLWDTRWIKERRSHKAHQQLQAEITANRGSLVIGRLSIHDIASIQTFSPCVRAIDLKSEFVDIERALPQDLQELEFDYLARRVSTLRSQGRTVDFNH